MHAIAKKKYDMADTSFNIVNLLLIVQRNGTNDKFLLHDTIPNCLHKVAAYYEHDIEQLRKAIDFDCPYAVLKYIVDPSAFDYVDTRSVMVFDLRDMHQLAI